MRFYLISIIHSLDILNGVVLGLSVLFSMMNLLIMSNLDKDSPEFSSAYRSFTVALGMSFVSAVLFVLIPSETAMEAILSSWLD